MNIDKLGKLMKGFEPPNTFAAFMFIAAGFYYFITKKTMKTLAVLLPFLTGVIWYQVNQLSEYTISIEPKKTKTIIEEPDSIDHSWSFSLFSEAYAQDRKTRSAPAPSQTWESPNAIVAGKEFYGFWDTDYVIYKEDGDSRIIIYNKRTNQYSDWIRLPDEVFMRLEKSKKQ